MKFLTFELIRAQLRLSDEQAELEHTLLESYGEAAEESVLSIIRRSLTDVVLKYNGVPRRLVNCALLLVDEWYQHHSPIHSGTLAPVPYAFDLMLKPLMRLSGAEAEEGEGSLPAGAIVSSDALVLVDKKHRIVCGKTV